MAIPDDGLWPLASSPERARWATQAVERYLHMARTILSGAAAWPAPGSPFPPEAQELARQLYEAIERRVDALGRPPRPDVLCAHCLGSRRLRRDLRAVTTAKVRDCAVVPARTGR